MAEAAEDLELVVGDPVEPDPDAVEPLEYDEMADNLIFQWKGHPEGDRAIERITHYAHETYKGDWDEQEEYREKQASDWKLFTGDIPKKKGPFEGCANIHVPIYMENVQRLHARLMKEIFGNWEQVFGAVSMGPTAKEVAQLAARHTNHQLCHGIPGFRREMERALLMFLCIGDVFAESYYDDEREENYHEVLTSDTFLIPFTLTTTRADLSDVPHKTRILYRYEYQLRASSEWANIDEILEAGPPAWDSDPEPTQRLSEAEGKGIHPPSEDRTKPYKIIRWDGWISPDLIPGQDRPRYMRVAFESQSMKPVMIRIHETEDWRDKRRYDQQLAELEQFRGAQEVREMEVAGRLGMVSASVPLDEDQSEAAEMQIRDTLPDVPAPTWLDDPDDPFAAPKPVKMIPINRYVHAVNMENLSGAHGIGTGAQQAHHNRAANTMTNQFVDQATLNNVPFMIKSALIQLREDKLGRPGMMLTADNAANEDIQNGIREIRPGPGNPQLGEATDKVIERSRSSMQSPEVLSGEPGKSGEPWRALASRIEQATTQLSTIGVKFVSELLTPIARNNADLNRIYLPDWQLQAVLDPDSGQAAMMAVSSLLYAQTFLWDVRADMRFSTKAQRVGEADELMGIAMGNPYLASNPALIHAIAREVFMARDRKDLVMLLGTPPPPPPQFMPPMPPGPPPGERPPPQ